MYFDNSINNIVIVISKLPKRHSKAKRRAPSYALALRRIRGVVQIKGIVQRSPGPISRGSEETEYTC